MIKSKSHLSVALIIALILISHIAGCKSSSKSGLTPIEQTAEAFATKPASAVKEALKATARGDIEAALEYVCKARKEEMRETFVGLFEHNDSLQENITGVDTSATFESYEITNYRVVVQAQGAITVSCGTTTSSNAFDITWDVVRLDKQWQICPQN